MIEAVRHTELFKSLIISKSYIVPDAANNSYNSAQSRSKSKVRTRKNPNAYENYLKADLTAAQKVTFHLNSVLLSAEKDCSSISTTMAIWNHPPNSWKWLGKDCSTSTHSKQQTRQPHVVNHLFRGFQWDFVCCLWKGHPKTSRKWGWWGPKLFLRCHERSDPRSLHLEQWENTRNVWLHARAYLSLGSIQKKIARKGIELTERAQRP